MGVRGGTPGGGEKKEKNVGKEKGGGKGRRKKGEKERYWQRRRKEVRGGGRSRILVLEKIRSGMESMHVWKAWGHCLCMHMCSCVWEPPLVPQSH